MGTSKKKKTTRKVLHAGHEVANHLVNIRDVGDATLPVIKLAYVCINDDPKAWSKRSGGMISGAMPRNAKIAAKLCAGARCFFCGRPQEPSPAKTLLDFHPEYPLCECLMPLRQLAYDYIPDWHTPEGNKLLVEQANAGVLNRNDPVYQYMCDCGEGPYVVHVGRVAHALTMFKRHRRLTRCDACHRKMAQQKSLQRRQFEARKDPLKVAVQELIEKPKTGPEGKITRDRKNKKNKPVEGAHPVFIPTVLQPLSALEAAPETPTT